MTTRKPGSTEDWTHLGKLDTSRLLVRAEGAIWTGLAAVGVPAGIIKVLKWSMRGAVLVAAAVYSLYLFVPLILGCLALWMVAQSSETQSESGENASSGYRNGISGYGFYDAAGIKYDD